MNIQEQVIEFLLKKAKQDPEFAGASSKEMAKKIQYKPKSIESQCLLLEHAGLIYRNQEDAQTSPNIWQRNEDVTVDTVKTGERTMSNPPGEPTTATEKAPEQGADLDQKQMFIDHLGRIGVTPKNVIPTVADIFWSGDIYDLSWLKQVLQVEAAGYFNPSQQRIIVSWWSRSRGLPFKEDELFPESEGDEKPRKGAAGKAGEDGRPEKRLDPGMGWKIGKDRDGDWVASPGGPMSYQEAVEAAERRHLIGAYQAPKADDDGEEPGEGESPKAARRGAKREDSLVEKMMLKMMDKMLDSDGARGSEADSRVERLQDQVTAMQQDRLEERFERMEGLVASIAARDPWEEYDKVQAMKDRLGVGGAAVTDQSPAVQIIKDSSDKLDKNLSRVVGIMERFILREGDLKLEETRSPGERETKAGELLETARSRDASRDLRRQTFGR